LRPAVVVDGSHADVGVTAAVVGDDHDTTVDPPPETRLRRY
jgi:hypothetical protein